MPPGIIFTTLAEIEFSDCLQVGRQFAGQESSDFVSPLPPACWSFPETASGMISSVGVTSDSGMKDGPGIYNAGADELDLKKK